MYNRFINNDELMHYGVKGMRWGVRKTPEYETQRKNRKIDKINRRTENRIEGVNIRRNKFIATREKNRKKSAARYDRKISKALSKGNTYKAETLRDKKAAKQAVWKRTTKLYNAGYNHYNKVLKDYAKTRISAINDPSYKKSEQYKNAGKAYTKQVLRDINNYGNYELTALQYGARKGTKGRY